MDHTTLRSVTVPFKSFVILSSYCLTVMLLQKYLIFKKIHREGFLNKHRFLVACLHKNC